MASKTTQSPSRIPVPVRSPPPPLNGRLAPARDLRETNKVKDKDSIVLAVHENGVVNDLSPQTGSPQNHKGKGFETFLMTGDMIIKTTPPHQPKQRQDGNMSGSPRSFSDGDSSYHSDQFISVTSPAPTVSGSRVIPRHPPNPAFPMELPRAPVATVEDLSDMSQSSGSESLVASFTDKMQLSQGDKVSPVTEDSSPVEAARSPVDVIIVNGDQGSDKSLQDVPSSGDSGVHPDIHSSDSDVGEKSSSLPEVATTEEAINRVMVTSQSDEKISNQMKQQPQQLVRTSKSHENYLESGNAMQLVSIDIEDNVGAYSLDQLAYNDNSTASLEKVTEPASRSLHNSQDKKVTEKPSEREYMPAFISLEDPKPLKAKVKDRLRGDGDSSGHNKCVNNSASTDGELANSPSSPTHSSDGSDHSDGGLDPNHIEFEMEMSDAESLYHQPLKGVDRPSASRLAKRLFMLDGFRKSDVSRHLSKKNEFSNLVAEEYLKYFEFKGLTLDEALRKFLIQFSLSGETQERERVLAHFSHHFMMCNPGSFNSDDACHTLTCAIMLLNTDLHGQFVGRKMTCAEFIDNLSELNDGENFPKEVLKSIYQSIKAEQIDWAVDDDVPEVEVSLDNTSQSVPAVPMIGNNPFLDTPDPSKTTEYKKGYVMRKCCKDMDGRRTPMGKRGWKMYCAVLRDMILYLYKDEHQLKKGGFIENANNSIRIHHALATKAKDYTKKQHVFRLQTADWSEFLFQTSDSKELQEWIDTINIVAASLSAPPLPGGCGSKGKFQRPLLSSCYTRHNLKEQLGAHEDQVNYLEQEMHQHRAMAPEKGAKARVIQDYIDKENYLENELARYNTYVYLLRGKMTTYPELEPSLVETAIGEDEEVGTVNFTTPTAIIQMATPAKPVQRSLSDRPEEKTSLDLNTNAASDFIYINMESFDTYL